MTGMAAPSGTLSGARGGTAGAGSPGTIAVAGGLPNGTAYLLDGAPQGFKVETTVNPDNPVATLNSPDFGRITGLAGGTAPRVMQLAIKYVF